MHGTDWVLKGWLYRDFGANVCTVTIRGPCEKQPNNLARSTGHPEQVFAGSAGACRAAHAGAALDPSHRSMLLPRRLSALLRISC